MITTIRDLSDQTGIPSGTIHARIKVYPINTEATRQGCNELVYPIGVLEAWHAKVDNIISGSTRSLTGFIKAGAWAKKKGKPLESNPYCYNTEIKQYCAWAAGWHDAK